MEGAALLIDLRPEDLRAREPLEGLTPLPSRAVTLDQIEEGAHGLGADLGPLLVLCERGVRSGLAAQYLRADGLEARAYPGGRSGAAAGRDGRGVGLGVAPLTLPPIPFP